MVIPSISEIASWWNDSTSFGLKTNPSQIINSEYLTLSLGLWLGPVMGMGLWFGCEAITLAIDAVIIPVGLLHPEKERLHLPDGEFLDGAGHLFGGADSLWISPAEQERNAANESNGTLGMTPFL